AGIPAAAGVRSALLAEEGLTGPPTVLEGNKGFCRVWVDNPRIEMLTTDLGSKWLMMDTSIKPYSCCGLIHTSLDILDRLRAEQGLRAEDVDEIFVGTSVQTRHHVGVIREPENVLAAQFSIPFSVAVNLIHGNNRIGDYREEDLHDQRFRELASRVVVEVDDAMEREYRNGNTLATKMRLKLRDGRVIDEYSDVVRGTPERPMTHAEVQDKFRTLVDGVIPAGQAERIVESVYAIESLRSTTKLVRLLVA
ncbi:MAG: MmgE/PrpD family protein, partial [Chloroflexi bacterium]|nr:MmgE/PrpD family protein [Chloroflexota bacterium]